MSSNKERSLRSSDLVNACGGYAEAVDAVVEFTRATFRAAVAATSGRASYHYFRAIPFADLKANCGPAAQAAFAAIVDALKAIPFGEATGGKIYHVLKSQLTSLFALPRILLADARPDHDLRYFVMRNVRRCYGARLTPSTAHLFHALAQEYQCVLDQAKGNLTTRRYVSQSIPLDYANLAEQLRYTATEELGPSSQPPEELFLECCWAAGYHSIHHDSGRIQVHATTIDQEYLLNRLFGMPTGITGLDELFGGGGLVLAEDPHPAGDGGDEDTPMPARTVLIKGGYGNGKSILALQLAAEVARKGGVAYVQMFEQTPTECLYTLESLRTLPHDESVEIATTREQTLRLLPKPKGQAGEGVVRPKPQSGAIILRGGVKESYNDYLATLRDDARRMRAAGYPLRVLIVDPVNTVARPNMDRSAPELRAEMVSLFNELKKELTNLILVAEVGGAESDLQFEENISDTVIWLSSETNDGYTQRVIEITKSRYQREQRGRHSFSIRPGQGISIFPSPAAVSARLSAREARFPSPDRRALFGIPALDAIVRGEGGDGLYCGDVIVVKAPDGSLKTPLGLVFLLAPDLWRDKSRNPPDGSAGDECWGWTARSRGSDTQALIVSTRESEAGIRHQLRSPAVSAHYVDAKRFKRPDNLLVCDFPARHADAGLILQRIEKFLDEAKIANRPVDRVVVDDVSFWDHSCPHVRNDIHFATTLVQLFRRHRITSLLVCGAWERDRGDAPAQRACTDAADCVIELDRWPHLGVLGRVLSTRDMRHDRVTFAIGLDQAGLRIDPKPLFRLLPGGELDEIPVRLFLHGESEAQDQYNKAVELAVQAVLSPRTTVVGQDRVFLRRALELGGASSTVDEVQILQLDEYQLPTAAEAAQAFTCFDPARFGVDEWSEFLPRLADTCRPRDGRFFAVPYYVNIGLLAYRDDTDLDPATCRDWRALADACARWEERNEGVFFDYPRQTSENYNCLFLEILSSLTDVPGASEPYDLQLWLRSKQAVEACAIFRQLGHRAYMAAETPLSAGSTPPARSESHASVCSEAVVWRHWYTTLNQMLAKDFAPAARQRVHVIPLPGGRAVAGEWVLAVPAYSAASDEALRVIRFLTSWDAESDRLQRGVGLPTRKAFYDIAPGRSVILVSPYFSLDPEGLKQSITWALRRSTIACYAQFAPHLAFHLRRLLELPNLDGEALRAVIASMLDDLNNRLAGYLAAQPARKQGKPNRSLSDDLKTDL